MIKLKMKYFSRLRIDIKLKYLIKSNKKGQLIRKLRFLFIDPEVDTFSYNQINTGEISQILSDFLEIEIRKIHQYYREGESLQRKFYKICWKKTLPRILFMKLFPKIGRNLNEYVCIRAIKPAHVIELGSKYGLGSWLIREAMIRNISEGFPCEVYSVDVDFESGVFLSLPSLGTIEKIFDKSIDFLKYKKLKGVSFIISDTIPDKDYISRELELSLQSGASEIYFQYNAKWAQDVLAHASKVSLISQKSDHPCYEGRDVYLGHFYVTESNMEISS